MGKNTFAPTTKCITVDFEDLKRKWITNKTKRGVGIIRMEQAMVLIEWNAQDIEMRNFTISITKMTSVWLIGRSNILSPVNASMDDLLHIRKLMMMKRSNIVLF
jgi:hypothetical protein